MNAPKEADVLKACRQLLDLHGCFALRLNVGAMSGKHKGKGWFVRFGEPGLSDLFALVPTPGWPHPTPLFIECKRAGGKQSAAQVAFQARVEAAGGVYLLVSDVRQLQAWLEAQG